MWLITVVDENGRLLLEIISKQENYYVLKI